MTKMFMRGGVYFGTAEDMIDRIEELEAVVGRQHKRAETLAEGWRIADDARIELEAKLAKVVEALYAISGDVPYADDPYDIARITIARITLAELKGEK